MGVTPQNSPLPIHSMEGEHVAKLNGGATLMRKLFMNVFAQQSGSGGTGRSPINAGGRRPAQGMGRTNSTRSLGEGGGIPRQTPGANRRTSVRTGLRRNSGR